MFARRKQKLRDDDEPLVPHGMVWQATEDEAMPADNLDSREAVPPRTPAIPVPIDAGKTERKTENQSDENLTPAKLGAISQPIAWPSARIQQIVRPRPEPENAARPISDVPAEKVSVEKKTKPEETVGRPQQPSSAPTSSDPDSQNTPKKKPQSETLGSRIGRTSRRISLAASDFARALTERIRDISSSAARRLRRNPGSAESDLGLSRLRELLGKLSGFVAEQVRVIRPELRHMASDARSRVNNWRESVAKTLPQRSRPSTRGQEVSERSQELSATNQATAFTSLSTVLRREWNRKYHIRVPALRSPYWRAQLASANRQWVLTRTSLRRNERILMPMVMAGISALLAIALISGLRRYAPPVNASHSTAAQPQSVPEVRPASLLVPAAEASTPPSASQPAEKSKAKKARHGGDDYVAKNTYVYYGIAGKPAQTTKHHK